MASINLTIQANYINRLYTIQFTHAPSSNGVYNATLFDDSIKPVTASFCGNVESCLTEIKRYINENIGTVTNVDKLVLPEHLMELLVDEHVA